MYGGLFTVDGCGIKLGSDTTVGSSKRMTSFGKVYAETTSESPEGKNTLTACTDSSGCSKLGSKHTVWKQFLREEIKKKNGKKRHWIQSISEMKAYKHKSHEELRLEDRYGLPVSKGRWKIKSTNGNTSMLAGNTRFGGDSKSISTPEKTDSVKAVFAGRCFGSGSKHNFGKRLKNLGPLPQFGCKSEKSIAQAFGDMPKIAELMSQFVNKTEKKSETDTGCLWGTGSFKSGNVSKSFSDDTTRNNGGLSNYEMNGAGLFGSKLGSKIGTNTVSFASKLSSLGSSNPLVGSALFGNIISNINCDETRGIFGTTMDETSGNGFLANSSTSSTSGLSCANYAKNNTGILGNIKAPIESNISGSSVTSNTSKPNRNLFGCSAGSKAMNDSKKGISNACLTELNTKINSTLFGSGYGTNHFSSNATSNNPRNSNSTSSISGSISQSATNSSIFSTISQSQTDSKTSKSSGIFWASTGKRNISETVSHAKGTSSPYNTNLWPLKKEFTGWTALPTKKTVSVKRPLKSGIFSRRFVPKRYLPKKYTDRYTWSAKKQKIKHTAMKLQSYRNLRGDTYDWRRNVDWLNFRKPLRKWSALGIDKPKGGFFVRKNCADFVPFSRGTKFEASSESDLIGQSLRKNNFLSDCVEMSLPKPQKKLVVTETSHKAYMAETVAIPSPVISRPSDISVKNPSPDGNQLPILNKQIFMSDPNYFPQRSFAPFCSNPNIVTCPSLEDLRVMPEHQLAAVVDFEIEHVVYGRIIWDGPLDLRGLDLDKVVRFTHGSFELYPEMKAAQEWGTGLMSACSVMLYNVWPKRNCWVNPPSNIRQQRFANKLAKHCKISNYDFIGYLSIRGLESSNREILRCNRSLLTSRSSSKSVSRALATPRHLKDMKECFILSG